MKPIFLPDYRHSIVNLSNSILKHYGCQIHHESLPVVDALLNQDVDHVALVLIDGMGDDNLARLLPMDTTLRRNQMDTLSSVFPPTTVAATTALRTGKTPLETAWLGWCQYVKEEDRNIVFFLNKDYYQDEVEFSYDIANRYVPVETIFDQIQKRNQDLYVSEIYPAFRTPKHTSFQAQVDTLLETFSNHKKSFTYIYWDQLDSLMHEYGPGAIEVCHEILKIDQSMKYLKENLPKKTKVLVCADHGQIDVCPIDLHQYPELLKTLERMPSIESRATSFFVKPEQVDTFVRLFHQYFRNYFILYTKEEVLKFEWFGQGIAHPRTNDFLGDYIAVAIDSYYFKMNQGRMLMRGQHAGLCKEEMRVPLLLFQN